MMFEGTIYKQDHRTTMGSPVSMVVPNLVMEDIETDSFVYLPHTHLFWRRNVDDTCTALPQDLVDSFHQHLNWVGPNIQFTVQKVKDGQLPYLDILLI